jgi:hypothetical protein
VCLIRINKKRGKMEHGYKRQISYHKQYSEPP